MTKSNFSSVANSLKKYSSALRHAERIRFPNEAFVFSWNWDSDVHKSPTGSNYVIRGKPDDLLRITVVFKKLPKEREGFIEVAAHIWLVF